MKVVLLSNSLSPHQTPLAEELCNLVGRENFIYIYTRPTTRMRKSMGWKPEAQLFTARLDRADCEEVLTCDVLLCGLRDMDLCLKRVKAGKKTFYMFERWFKPPLGLLRLCHPGFLRTCRKFLSLSRYESFSYLPIGVHAARDAIRLAAILRGRLAFLFRQPKVAFESRPGGAIVPLEDVTNLLSDGYKFFSKRNGFAPVPKEHWGRMVAKGFWGKMRLWGYFVEASKEAGQAVLRKEQALWVGRMDRLKKLPSIIEACVRCHLALDVYGHGEDEARCRKLARGNPLVRFHDYVPIEEVRRLMQESSIYVFGSNGSDGWGAVVSEAAAENMVIIGSIEAGAPATILPMENLYHSGNVEELCDRIKKLPALSPAEPSWTVGLAAKVLLTL